MRYFNYKEFDQPGLPGSGEEHMKKSFLSALDELRSYAAFPFIINSGYRSLERNLQIGGAPKSYHVRGRAADIRVDYGWQVYAIMKFAPRCGLHGIGISFPKNGKPGFVHVDDRDAIKQTVWGY